MTIETSEPELRQLDDGSTVMRVKAVRKLRTLGGEVQEERPPETVHRLAAVR